MGADRYYEREWRDAEFIRRIYPVLNEILRLSDPLGGHITPEEVKIIRDAIEFHNS